MGTGIKRGGEPKRTAAERAKDFLFITPLFLKGVSYRQIAEIVNADREYAISSQQIFYDVKKIIDAWQKERNVLIDKQKTVELAKIDHLEATYWEAWDRSLKPKIKRVTKESGDAEQPKPQFRKRERHTTESIGDSKWLDGIQWCIDQRCMILGMKRNITIELPPAKTAVPVDNIIFETDGLKSNQQYEDAVEVKDEPGEDNIQTTKLLG